MKEHINNYTYIIEDEINSTNAYAVEYIVKNKDCDKTVIVANKQYDGKGQRGNKWEAEPFKNLTFSIIYEPKHVLAHEQFVISELVSLGVCDYLSQHTQGVSIKWPNDIYIGDKKVAGILIEHEIRGSRVAKSICGLGLNINQEVFRSDAPNPVSLKQITGVNYSLEKELLSVVDCIDRRYKQSERIEFDFLMEDYYKVMYRRDGFYTFREDLDEFEAKVVCVNELGQLLLERRDGVQKIYNFKEVAFVI